MALLYKNGVRYSIFVIHNLVMQFFSVKIHWCPGEAGHWGGSPQGTLCPDPGGLSKKAKIASYCYINLGKLPSGL